MVAAASHLFTASQVARFCQVDLKTIHNWADRGEIHHFRTPGRHLRFEQPDVLDFLRRYGYPIPTELRNERPHVVVLLEDRAQGEEAADHLNHTFEVTVFDDAAHALIHMGSNIPDALVLDEKVGTIEGADIIASLKQSEPTKRIRAVLFSNSADHKDRALGAGASAHVHSSDLGGLQDTLVALMGTRR